MVQNAILDQLSGFGKMSILFLYFPVGVKRDS
jgi:hypothetical protein